MCPYLALIKDRSLGYSGVNYYSPPWSCVCQGRDGSHWRDNPAVCTAAMFTGTSHHRGKKSWDKMLMQGQRSVSLCLCDFSQSRLLINFQIINVKVTETPFHSGADKPAHINIPVSGCRSGWYDTHGLIPSLPRCCCHVNFSPRGNQMPSKSVSSTAGAKPFNCLQKVQDRKTVCGHTYSLLSVRSVKTVLTSCNLFALLLVI